MKRYIILLALIFGVLTIHAQSDTTQNAPSQNMQSDTTQAPTAPSGNLQIDTTQSQSSPSESAQSESSVITDEELGKYAVMMDSVNDMKQTLLKEITAMVKGNAKLKTARYNELTKIIDDEAALTKAKATPEEIAFVKEVATKKEEGTARIQETFQTMAKDHVGASSYNKIKSALESDEEVKQRYQAQLNKLSPPTGGN